MDYPAQTATAMVALAIPAHVTERIAVDGGLPPEALHITLAVIPDATPAVLAAAAEAVAGLAHWGPCAVNLTHVSHLGPDGDLTAVALEPRFSAELDYFRQSTTGALDRGGVAWSDKYAYRPHVTVTYLSAEKAEADYPPGPMEGLGVSFSADTLILVYGDRVVASVDLNYREPDGPMESFKADGQWNVAKSDDAAQQVFGWANISLRKDGEIVTDLHADQIDPGDLEQSAYQFVVDQGMSGVDHDGAEPNGVLIESMFFSAEKQQALGIPEGTLPVGWWLGFHFPDRAIYESVVKGERTMFSVEGTAYYEEIEAA